MQGSTRIVLVAVAAGLLGLAVGLASSGPGPLLRFAWGQRALQGWFDLGGPRPPPGVAVARLNQRVPDFTVRDLQGTALALPAAVAGRPVLVNLWASWCGPCIEEMPELDRFASEQGANGVQVLGIALDDPAAVTAFLQQVPVGYRIAVDQPGSGDAGVRLGNAQGVLPYTALLDADGRLLKRKIGPFAPGEVDRWVAR